MGKLKLTRISAIRSGLGGIVVNNPNLEISIDGGYFEGNGGPDIDVRRAKGADIQNCEFRGENKPDEKKATKGYVSGCSFSKGEHLKDK